MNKKAFTLIELIGVIVILSLMLLLIVPNVVTTLKEGNETSEKFQNQTIILGAKNWASDNKGLLPQTEGGTKTITLKDLQNGGYVEKNIKDPKTGNVLNSDTTKIVITKKGKNYVYEIK